jgi:hypothetical protein
MVLIPLLFGVGIIFYNGKNPIGWALAGGSLVALVAGVLMNIHFILRPLSLFDLLCILILTVGGFSLFLKSLRGSRETDSSPADQS